MIRIALADDHRVLLEGIESLINQEKDLAVVAKAHHGEELLAKLSTTQVDLVVLDIDMPGKNGIEICSTILSLYPQTRILVMSMHQDPFHVQTMVNKGVDGYLTKNATHQEMLQAIRSVASHTPYFSQEAHRALQQPIEESPELGEPKFILKLSPREKEVLRLIVEEHTTTEIGDKLCISIKTVETHRRNLLSKLNARNTAGLVRIAVEQGLV